MLQAERLEAIKTYMLENKFAKTDRLEQILDTSRATVRRCLLQLESEGFLRMIRGGAVLSGQGSAYEQPYNLKRDTNQEEKKRIAKKAVELIGDNFSVFLDTSTTVAEMIPFLGEQKNLMVATNDVLIAASLKDNTNMAVTVIGGTLRCHYYSLTGLFAEMLLKEMSFDCAFLGIDAISEKGGFMLTNTEEVPIKRLVAQSAGKLVVLCDHSKFDKSSFVNVCDFQGVDIIITGRELESTVHQRYRDLGPEIILA